MSAIRRTRSENDTTPLPTSYSAVRKDAWTCDTSERTETLDFPVNVGISREMSDCVVPGFARRSARGEVFNNPMSKTKTIRTCNLGPRSYTVNYTGNANPPPDCTFSWTCGSSPAALNIMGGATGHLDLPDINVSRLRSLAGTQATAAIDSPEFQGAVFLAELRETIGYLSNPLRSYQKFLTKVRRDKRKGEPRNPRYHGKRGQSRLLSTREYLSQEWLSYRYALRPIAYDTSDALDAIVKVVSGVEPVRKTARGSASATSSTNSSGPAPGSSSYEFDQETRRTVDVRAGVLYELSRSSDTFGVDLLDLPLAAWEAIPFSFIADWFANIGPFISAISPVSGVNRLASWTSVKTIDDTSRNAWWETGGSIAGFGDRIISANGMVTETYFTETYSRTPGLQVDLVLENSPLTGDIGKKRILDLIALSSETLRSQ